RVLAVAAWATLDVAFSPVSADYHYVLMLAPIGILLADWRDTRPSWAWLANLVFGNCLMGAPLPYKSPSLALGGWSIFAYPKLYGALLLWILTIAALRQEQSVSYRERFLRPRPSPALERP